MKFLRVVAILLSIFSYMQAGFYDDAKELKTKSFKKKESIIKQISTNYKDDKNLSNLLKAMLDGKLYYIKNSGDIVMLVEKNSNTYTIKEFLTTNKSSQLPKKELKKVKINNKLRGLLKNIIAKLDLSSKDDDKREAAAYKLLEKLDSKNSDIINQAIKNEKDSGIKDILHEALLNLHATNLKGDEQLKAIDDLSSYISKTTQKTLNSLILNSQDKEVVKMSKKSLSHIELKKSFYSFIQTAFFGLSLGSVLLLAAIGLSITFGVMGVINMAHGELIMIGAYVAYMMEQLMPNLVDYSIILAIPVAFVVSGIFGILIERLVVKHLYGRPLETLLATFGVSLVLQQLARSVFSPLNQEVKTPSWMSGAMKINDSLFFTYNRLYVIVFTFILFLAILYVMKKTSFGLKIRAVSQNRPIARAMGIRSDLIDALTFGLGTGIAGVAGVMLSQLTNVGPNLGQSYIIDSFMVVVFGGVGNLWGTFIAAIGLGEVNKFIEPLSGAVLAKVFILIFIILFIQKKPRGLFPKKGRDAT